MHTVSLPQYAIERGRVMHPLKMLDGARTAVLAIDFQRFFIDADQPMGNVHARDMLATANRVHAVVRDKGGLVIFTQHSLALPAIKGESTTPMSEQTLLPGSKSYELHAALERTEKDLLVIKYQSSPLHPKAVTQLHDVLRQRGIENLIVTGLVTNGCCDCTARDGFQYGFNMVVAADATAAMTDEEHNAALLNLGIYYARVLDAEGIAATLA